LNTKCDEPISTLVSNSTCAITLWAVGHLKVLKWAREHGGTYRMFKYVCSNAAGGGHLEVLKWAHEQSCRWDEETCENAARGGYTVGRCRLKSVSYNKPRLVLRV